MKVTRRQLRNIVKEALQESNVKIDDVTMSRIDDARKLFGDDEFIEEMVKRIPRDVLAKALIGIQSVV